MKNTRLIFGLWTFVIVLLISLPDLNYYPLLSQGDHGRDLYAAQAVLRGELPYKDFWWVYGPIMPYYYAFFYKVFGGTIGSFLLGKTILKLACALFFYLAASEIIPCLIAFMAALWFAHAQQDFFFTFNHIGGIACQLWILYTLFAYIRTQLPRYLWQALPAVFLYCLIKINFGLVSLLMVGVTVFCCDFIYKIPWSKNKKRLYLAAFVGLPILVGIIYWLFIKDLPLYVIRQCFPYFGDDQPYHYPPSKTIPYYFMQHWLTLVHAWLNFTLVISKNWASSWIGIFMMISHTLSLLVHVLLHAATLVVIYLFCTKNPAVRNKKFLLTLGMLLIFFILNSHEFLASGVWYRTFWPLPFVFMFHFIVLWSAFSILPKIARGVIWSIFALLLLLGFISTYFSTQQQKTPDQLLSGPHAQIYIGNEPEWVKTVNTVSGFLNQDLRGNEQFFALPYDCIYYYLTNTPSPSRQLIFFDHIKVRPEQEKQVIHELETKNVKYVLMSNRMASSETGLGILGKTYCPLISSYINANFQPFTRQGGDWQKEPGWGNNHGVMILKKK